MALRVLPFSTHLAWRLAKGSFVAFCLAAIGLVTSTQPFVQDSAVVRIDADLKANVTSDSSAPGALSNEGQRANPVDFSAEELWELQRRFGVHGPQPELAQLLTQGLDQLTPFEPTPSTGSSSSSRSSCGNPAVRASIRCW